VFLTERLGVLTRAWWSSIGFILVALLSVSIHFLWTRYLCILSFSVVTTNYKTAFF